MVLDHHAGIERDIIADLNEIELGEEAGVDEAVTTDLAPEQAQERRGEGRPKKLETTGAMIDL